MKKTIILFLIGCLTLGMLSACGNDTVLLAATDYELDADTKETSRGISIGDGSEAFLAAYGEYEMLTSVDGSDYQLLSSEEIPFDSSSIQIILPTFFIDGLAIDTDQFCKELEIEKSNLLAYLSSEEYLSVHTVVYHYLIFAWENGSITEIHSESMDYNADAAYYDRQK